MNKKISKVQALLKLLKDSGGRANWNTIYQKIGLYYPELKLSGKKALRNPEAGIRGVLYRDCDQGRYLFTKVGEATFGITYIGRAAVNGIPKLPSHRPAA